MRNLKNLFIVLTFFLMSSIHAEKELERWGVSPQADLYANKIGKYINNIKLKDLNAQEKSLYSESALYTVISVFDVDCPLALKLVPKVKRLEKEYSQLKFKHIYISKLASKEKVLKEYRKREYTGQLLFDTGKLFLNELEVKTTCETFVIDQKGTLVYRGAIDDQYGINIIKEKAENLYLKDALKNLLANKKVQHPLTGAPGCLVDSESTVENKSEVTFHKDISRILQNKCQQCHHKGGVGPFELITYEQAKERRKMIKYVLRKDLMPPWFADKNRSWLNNYDLSDAEKETLNTWLNGGTPAGDKSKAPLAKEWSTEGLIKKPDLIVSFPKVKVQAEGFMKYQHKTVKIPIKEDRWVRAIETRTENPQVLHHALVFLSENGEKKRLNALSGFFSGYVPGTTINEFADGTGKLLPKGSYLVAQLHYTPNGTAVEDVISLAFDFYDEKPNREVITKSAFNAKLKIPANKDNHVVLAEHSFYEDGFIVGLNPHAHLRGKSFKYELQHPNGKKELLIDIPKYDFNWQINYQPMEPIFTPNNSVLKVTAVFDNSSNNKSNPNPNAVVRFGEQTDDEMMIGYFEWYASNPNSESKDGLGVLPKALKTYVLKIKSELKAGAINKQQARKSITKNIRAGVKKGSYPRSKVQMYSAIIIKDLNKL